MFLNISERLMLYIRFTLFTFSIFSRHTKGNNNADSISHFPNQNGITPNTVNYCTDVDDVGKEEEKGNACCAGSNFNEYDDDDTCNDESKSNEFSGNYLLNITLDNLKQIKEAVQSEYLRFIVFVKKYN